MSTVRITWVDSVTPGVTGHKIYRDDVELADVGLLVQTYDDTTAAEDTTYKYEVQAYTATGESIIETLGVNMNNITTAVGVTVPAPDLYDSAGALSMPQVNIPLGTAGINSPSGTIYIEYDTSLLTGSNYFNFGLMLNGGNYMVISLGSSTTKIVHNRRVGFGTAGTSANPANDNSVLTKAALVWGGTRQELWIGGSMVVGLTGLDAIPAATFDNITFDSPSSPGATKQWLNTVHQVSLWSTELTTPQLIALTT